MIFKKLLSEIDGGMILDVGCGSGQFTGILVKYLASYETITGVDVDEKTLREAGKNFPGKEFIFHTASAQDLPFDEGSFDTAVISRALHHMENPVRTLEEMHRVLRPGGYLLINEMTREVSTDAQESHLLYHHLRSEIDNALGISHNHTFKKDDLIRLGSGLRLNDMQIHEFIPETEHVGMEENILEFSGKLDAWMEELEGQPRRNEFVRRIEQVRKRIKSHGISRPPQLVIFGRR